MIFPLVIALAIGALALYAYYFRGAGKFTKPISVNYHFTRRCNATCSFCFHTAKTSYVCSEKDAFRGLRMLKDAGMLKVNFAGGEPFLYPSLLGKMVRYCKESLRLESVSIVTNGSKVTESWFAKYGAHVDILAVSCDSFDHATNLRIGRTDNGKDYDNIGTLARVAALCRAHGVKFKLNTVVCRLNWQEDMFAHVAALRPARWKAFQVLIVAGENDSEEARRNATELTISADQFRDFCRRHEHLDCFVPEDNDAMKASYILLDEYMCFLDKDRGVQSKSILEVGVHKAMSEIVWDEQAFVDRGGVYDWKRSDGNGSTGKGCSGSGGGGEELSW